MVHRHSLVVTLSHPLAASLIMTAICLFLVNQHPPPIDDFPCFEDAITFVSLFVGFWLLALKARAGAKH